MKSHTKEEWTTISSKTTRELSTETLKVHKSFKHTTIHRINKYTINNPNLAYLMYNLIIGKWTQNEDFPLLKITGGATITAIGKEESYKYLEVTQSQCIDHAKI